MNNDDILITVIMGVYNVENKEVLQASIASILNQTIKNIEFIICDDGSRDNTYEFLENIKNIDDRIVLLKNEMNVGLASTLNICLKHAKGKYVARMDADDISMPDRLKKQLDFLENNYEYDLVGCSAELIDDTGIWGKRLLKERPVKEDFLWGSPFMHPTVMLRQETYANLNGYCVSKRTLRLEDYDFFMRLYASGYKGYNLQEYLFQYREDKESIRRKKYKYRIDEVYIRFKGYKLLHLMPIGFIFMLKPLVVGLIPQYILKKMR